MRRVQQRTRLVVVAAASFVLLVLVLPQLATGIGLGGLASRLTSSGSCGSSGSSGSMGSGSGSSSVCGPPTLTAVPDTALADGQSITVTGSSFSPFSGVGMVECENGATGPQQCDLSTLLEVGTDGSGSFSTTYVVSRIVNIPTKAGKAKTLDCAVSRCFLGAADISNYSVAALARLGFNPKSPLVLRGSLATTDTVVPRTGVASISGTALCTRTELVNVTVELQQIFRRRFNFTNYGQTTIVCKGHSPWTVTVPPGFGLFFVGPANVTAQLSTQIGNSYRNVGLAGAVVLQSAKKK